MVLMRAAGGDGRTRKGREAAWGRLGAEPGLCRTCRHARLKTTPRSAFLRCSLADHDPRFERYPRLPVLACAGHEPQREP